MNCKRWLLLLVVAMFGLCTVVVTGFGQELAEEQIVRVGLLAGDIGPMDPHQPNLAQDTPIQQLVWNLLVGFEEPGNVTTQIVPELAEKWETSENQLVWTFYLRKGVQFHKGYGELTAADVKFSYDRVMDPERSAKSATPPWTSIESVKVVDDHTVEVHLAEPLPDLLPYLATMQSGVGILCRKSVEEQNDEIRTEIIGSGPWMWGEYMPQDHLTLIKNPDYWEGEVVVEKIVYFYMPSDESRVLALLGGELEAAKLPADQIFADQLESAGKVVDALGPGASGFILFNMERPPLDSWLVRAAIAYAIDRPQVSAAFGTGAYIEAKSVVPDSWLYGTYDGVPTYDYNPELARNLLAAAGYPDGLRLQSYTSTRSFYLTQFEVLQAQLKRVGIDLELIVVDHTTFHANQRDNLNDIVIFGNGGWNGEQHLWTFWHSSTDISNPEGYLGYAHYGNVYGSIDALLDEAVGQSVSVKAELYKRAQQKILLDLAGYPLIRSSNVCGRQPYLDLGYEPKNQTTGSFYNMIWLMRVLEH